MPIEHKLAHLFGYDHVVMLGRARSGLVALLEVFQGENIPVLLPENICPVLVTAIRAGGGIAVTVPVSPETGLTDDATFVKAMNRFETPGIISPTHLYGFQGEYPRTIKLAREKGWFILENDANATRFGTSGAFGDALLVSFGYAKPIEIGTGGALLTNDVSLAHHVAERVSGYDVLNNPAQKREEDCMLERRAIRQNLDINAEALRRICELETNLSRFRFDEKNSEHLNLKFDQFPDELARRMEQRDIWDRVLTPLDEILQPIALQQPVPWRIIRRLPQNRDHFTRKLWANGMDAGINYRSLWRELPPDYLTGLPSSPDLWGDRVLNLWATKDYDKTRIEKTAHLLMEAAHEL